jgi:hypothetical protein
MRARLPELPPERQPRVVYDNVTTSEVVPRPAKVDSWGRVFSGHNCCHLSLSGTGKPSDVLYFEKCRQLFVRARPEAPRLHSHFPQRRRKTDHRMSEHHGAPETTLPPKTRQRAKKQKRTYLTPRIVGRVRELLQHQSLRLTVTCRLIREDKHAQRSAGTRAIAQAIIAVDS